MQFFDTKSLDKYREILFGPSLMEIGWEIFRWVPYIRWYKKTHPNKKIIAVTREDRLDLYFDAVDETDDAIEAMEHQNDIQPLYTGGTIFHTFLGERMENAESCKRLVKKIAYNTKIPYFTITPTFSVCPVHGYVPGEYETCPYDIATPVG